MRCPVCGADHATCGGPWTGQFIDTIVEAPRMQEGPTRRYRDAQGHVFSLTEKDAARLGYTPVDGESATEGKAVNSPPENKAMQAPNTK